ncbi:YraN family protein [Actinomyces trachealis]|uniref:YraN family protein n=1 Tax=Actinomyces trachealis TaxID=2763540 RepID=UPI001FD4BD26|nr:YraN family protein [Actinomyces trachealis]
MKPTGIQHLAPDQRRHQYTEDAATLRCTGDGILTAASNPRAELGRQGEAITASHLEAQGWRVLDRNWRPGPSTDGQAPLRGELDLVALDPAGALVVVEVKTRRTERYGPPAAAVGPGKLHRLRLLAAAWVRNHDREGNRPLRLDVVSVLLPAGCAPVLRHHRGVGL